MSPRQPENLLLYDMGKVPPQAIDIEEAVLGALLIESQIYKVVGDMIIPELFYKENHKIIFEAIKSLHGKSIAVDILTVTNELRSNGKLEIVGGAYAVSTMTNHIASTANIEYHIRILIEMYLKRELIQFGSDLAANGFDNTKDVFELIEGAEKSVNSIVTNKLIQKQDITVGNYLREAIRNIESASEAKTGLTGLPSGFTEIDRVTNGWQNTDLIILSARPGTGKTSLMLCIAAAEAIDFNIPTVIFSLEMSAVQLVKRILSFRTNINNEYFKSGNLSQEMWYLVNDAITKILNAPLYIDDTGGLSIQDIRAKAIKYKEQYGIRSIYLDYIQLANAGKSFKGNREQEVSTISRGLKSLAKDLNVPIIALSQLSREVEKRSDKRPMLSDLRDSGALEQDTDLVAFIYREEMYNVDAEPGKAELIIAKNRNGSLKTVNLKFIGETTKFEDYNNFENLTQTDCPF